MFLLAGVLSGCFSAGNSPPAANLSEQHAEIQETSRRVVEIGETLTNDITRLRTLQDEFLNKPKYHALLSKPYPVHLFKHTAIACLNEPYEAEPEPDTPSFEAAEQVGIKCVVMPLPELLKRVKSELPGRWDDTLSALQLLDEMRTLRANVNKTLRRFPDIIRSTKNFIAVRRAEVRRLEIEVERNKPEFANDDYSLSKRRIKKVRQDLKGLEEDLAVLGRNQNAWSIALRNATWDLYEGITLYESR